MPIPYVGLQVFTWTVHYWLCRNYFSSCTGAAILTVNLSHN